MIKEKNTEENIRKGEEEEKIKKKDKRYEAKEGIGVCEWEKRVNMGVSKSSSELSKKYLNEHEKSEWVERVSG